MFRYMKRHLLVVLVFASASIGLASSAHAQLQDMYGITIEDKFGNCFCHVDIEGAIECAFLGDGACDNATLPCHASGGPICPTGLCISAVQIGCAENQCLSQNINCDQACADPSMIGNIVECDILIPTVSEWSLIIMTVLAFIAGTILFGRRRSAAA